MHVPLVLASHGQRAKGAISQARPLVELQAGGVPPLGRRR